MVVEYLMPVLASMLFYCGVNIALQYVVVPPPKLTDSQKKNYIGEHISLIHSIFASILALSVYISENGINYDTPTNASQIIVLGHSMGYFTYDAIYAELFGLHDWAMRFHHIFVIFGGFPAYLASNGGSLGVTCLVITELSNPTMQLRLILKDQGNTDSLLYKISQFSFAAIFLFNRGVIGTFLDYNSWQYNVNIMLAISVSMLYGVSCFWNYIIILMILKELKGKGTTLKERLISKSVHILKKSQTVIVALIFIWAVFMPHILKHFGFTAYHLKYGNFTII
ncbi:unnamed protein product [Blepharisma stoltei]|uniref:TLC domain-containing protein n=1 Tax=Blepharisma stoltei TaxID=1481888 RepID=A0AAU9JJ28_9CILI|nr:unnamed protein product [Blepharisma stoltei]